MSKKLKKIYKKEQDLEESIQDKVRSYSGYYIGKTFLVIKASNQSHTSVTKVQKDSLGSKYVIIHMESKNGKNYKDIKYPGMELINEVGEDDSDMQFMKAVVGIITSTNSIWGYCKE